MTTPDDFTSALKHFAFARGSPTLRRGGVVGIGVALTAVLHLEAGKVPGHADDAVRFVQEDVGQHAPVAVHHYHLSVRSTKQHL